MSLAACSSGSKSTAADSGKTSAQQSHAAGTSPGSKPTSAPAASKAGSAGGGVDVCSLMSAAQASSINHVTYGTTKAQHVEAGFDVCTYTNTGKHASPIDIQDLSVKVISISGCYAQLNDAQGPGKKVTGVGDAAFGYEIGIVVESGNTCIDIQGLTAAEFHDNYAPDAAMAKIVISALH